MISQAKTDRIIAECVYRLRTAAEGENRTERREDVKQRSMKKHVQQPATAVGPQNGIPNAKSMSPPI